MKIINYEKNISIEYFAGNIYYDKQIIMNVENKCFFELNELISVLKYIGFVNTKLDIFDIKYEPKATEILFALTCLNNYFYIAGEVYDLTFAAAIPIGNDFFIMNCIKYHLKEYLSSGQVYVMSHSDLYLIEKISLRPYLKTCTKEKKTIAKNKRVNIIETLFSEEFFEFWKKYYKERFQITMNEKCLSFYRFVFKNSQFKLYQYEVDSKIVAYNVCYFSETQKIIYDITFPWIMYKDTYRIGIFSVIVNLTRALNKGWGYSLCYGKYDYKDSIMKYF
jgi:hypothetical protein